MTTCPLSTLIFTFKVQHRPVFSPVWFPLPYNHSGHYCRHTRNASQRTRKAYFTFLSKLWLSFLHGRQDKVPCSSGWKTVQTTLDALHGNDVQVLAASVVGTVDDRAHGQTQRDTKLCSSGSLRSYEGDTQPSYKHNDRSLTIGTHDDRGRCLQASYDWAGSLTSLRHLQ